MAELDIELENDLLDGVRRLAARHYGDVGDASIVRVTEVALEMRLLWQEKGGKNEVEEPLVNWEFGNTQPMGDENTNGIRRWLFRR